MFTWNYRKTFKSLNPDAFSNFKNSDLAYNYFGGGFTQKEAFIQPVVSFQ